MTPSNYQRTRWLTLIGTIITQFALGSVYTWSPQLAGDAAYYSGVGCRCAQGSAVSSHSHK